MVACAVLLAGTALLPASDCVLAWGALDVAYLAGFATVLIMAGPAGAPGVVITEALTERFGAFTIIVLGETLTGVVTGLAARPVSGLTLAVGLAAVVVGFGAWWTYFDFAGQRQPRAERVASTQWILGHLPLTAAVAAMGAAMGAAMAQPGRARPGRPHPGRDGVGAGRGRRRRAGRDDAARRDPAGLEPRPRPVPAARLHLHRLRRGLPRPRRRPACATSPRLRARRPPQHPLGVRRRASPGERIRFARPVTVSAQRSDHLQRLGLAHGPAQGAEFVQVSEHLEADRLV